MTDPLDIYKGEFGNEWMDRNDIDPDTRVEAFRKILKKCEDLHSILEVGCGIGYNLEAIERVDKNIDVFGVEPNEYARKRAMELYGKIIFPGNCYNIPMLNKSVDMVMTCGMLMHVPEDRITNAITQLLNVTRRYILVMEYYCPQHQKIKYREHDDLLFKRPYGSYFVGRAKRVSVGDVTKEEGFDNLRYWLLEKV